MAIRWTICDISKNFARVFVLTLCLILTDCYIDAKGYGYHIPVYSTASNKICSNECREWKPKHCWDGYLKRKVWKMVCEHYDTKCCPGYKGPNCEEECFNCDKINGFERHIVEIYGKIQTLDDKCSNISNNGGGGGNGGSCTCPAGPRGERGSPGPLGPPGIPGPQGVQGPQGPLGKTGNIGPPGPQGLNGLPGADGRPGRSGLTGQKGGPGERGDPGLPGMQGLRGSKGDQGLNGLNGLTGEPGAPGLPGADGLPGQKGEPGQGLPSEPGLKGETGEQGIPGYDGRDGLPGQKGERGERGIDGLPGLLGNKGEMGLRGLQGYPGEIGLPGSNGVQGFNGRPGSKGEPGDITKIEESRIIHEMQNTIKNLVTRLETTTREVTELRVICEKINRCYSTCDDDSFLCSCGMCIPHEFQCDGFPQCPDGSDEDDAICDYRCTIADFQCESSGLCIPLEQKCNGVNNCPDASDESTKHCRPISCNEGNVPCRDGTKCVAREERCDGKEDCSDGSDEEDCKCKSGYWKCVTSGECIDEILKCNNEPNCVDESDESDDVCESSNGVVCVEGQKACDDLKSCINANQFCDGIVNCFDRSDEINCDRETTTPKTTSPEPEASATSTSTTQKPVTTTTTTSTTPVTTTTTTSTTPKPVTTTEEDIEGSGDYRDCEELYQNWKDAEFPGGNPPPLSPDETVITELCSFIRNRLKEDCAKGGANVVNATLCEAILDMNSLPEIAERRKRHRQHGLSISDDEELKNMMGDQPIRDLDLIEEISDISFDDLAKSDDTENKYNVESIDFLEGPEAIAWKTSKTSHASRFNINIKLVFLTLSSFIIYHFI